MNLISTIGKKIADRIIAIGENRPYDFAVGGAANPYMLRWWIIPRNKLFNIYLHKFLRDDEDRACHDHPWVNVSILLRGSYLELIEHIPPAVSTEPDWRVRCAGSVVYRNATFRHRIALHRDNGVSRPCWSLFITGPRVRNWGFWCPKGFVPWEQFVKPGAKGEVGPGCGD